MLETLRQRVVEALTSETAVTLSTSGPGGIQAGFFPCETADSTLYLLVPAASDVLFNLESETAVVVTTPYWQMEGKARVHTPSQIPPTVHLTHSPEAAGCVVVAVQCRRMHFKWAEGWGYKETIDCNDRQP